MNEINSWIVGGLTIIYAVTLYRLFVLAERARDLRHRLDAQIEIDRDLDRRLESETEARICAQGKASETMRELNEATDSLRQAKEENGNLNIQVKALMKDIESIRAFNGDMHRVIDMDALKLKEKDRIIAEQQVKIDRLMKIRKR